MGWPDATPAPEDTTHAAATDVHQRAVDFLTRRQSSAAVVAAAGQQVSIAKLDGERRLA
ncbi:hypothetical protein ACWDUN_27515 [Mycobacterium sp. NPDC003323]